jgi:predicted nucleic acid-binding protein
MLVVSNTSPLNYLILIDCQQVLPALFGKTLIPRAVYHEQTAERSPQTVRRWLEARPDWLDVREVSSVPGTLQDLDPGEREAITLAESTGAHVVLLDERRARRMARERGLAVTGTLGLLAAAGQRGLLHLPDAIAPAHDYVSDLAETAAAVPAREIAGALPPQTERELRRAGRPGGSGRGLSTSTCRPCRP